MSADLTFLMGKFPARIPADRQYAKNHLWAQPREGTVRFGFSAYAVRLLQDVYFLEWSVDAETPLAERQAIGAIESSKAESDLYAPMAGRLVRFNERLLSDPSGINVDNYGEGWLFEMAGSGESLLSPEEYLAHLETSWAVAQRTIKGQINEE
ncbi:MAG TPA: glycine cleavage system protein H [Pirellulales bacterium]|nr:glycine cleavage system protein H [Pirellulales bacterium]